MDPSIPPSEFISDSFDTAVATTPSESLIPALQFGDLAAQGLAAHTPVGLYQLLLEYINVSYGLPWFWTIAAAGALTRLALTPLTIMAAQQMAINNTLTPQLKPIMEQSTAALRAGDRESAIRLSKEAQAIRSVAGGSPLKALVPAVLQLTATVSSFLGVRQLCELPIVQLTHSGVDWLPDLTALPPHWFAATFAGTVFLQGAVRVLIRDLYACLYPVVAGREGSSS